MTVLSPVPSASCSDPHLSSSSNLVLIDHRHHVSLYAFADDERRESAERREREFRETRVSSDDDNSFVTARSFFSVFLFLRVHHPFGLALLLLHLALLLLCVLFLVRLDPVSVLLLPVLSLVFLLPLTSL